MCEINSSSVQEKYEWKRTMAFLEFPLFSDGGSKSEAAVTDQVLVTGNGSARRGVRRKSVDVHSNGDISNSLSQGGKETT